jgi:hypothetical protein
MENGCHNQNYKAESKINVLKRKWQALMLKLNVPRRLWDFGLVLCAEIMSRTARGPDRRTGYEEITWEDYRHIFVVGF